MALKQICDRCGTESERTFENSFGSVTIRGITYLICPECAVGYDTALLYLREQEQDVLFQWVNKGG